MPCDGWLAGVAIGAAVVRLFVRWTTLHLPVDHVQRNGSALSRDR